MSDVLTSNRNASADHQVDMQLDALEERLLSHYRREHPDSEGILREFLADARARFADARIRTFLPILIERAVHARMRLELAG